MLQGAQAAGSAACCMQPRLLEIRGKRKIVSSILTTRLKRSFNTLNAESNVIDRRHVKSRLHLPQYYILNYRLKFAFPFPLPFGILPLLKW
jgi:hypothetical protein